MIIIGIDPGSSSGGIAISNSFGSQIFVEAYGMPETEVDICELLLKAKILARPIIGTQDEQMKFVAYLEKVHSMPKQGVSSVFTFGQNYGMLRGILAALGIKREFVTPQKWQKAMGCITPKDWTKTRKKNFHKSKAQELFPGMKITHAIADALLIAEYGRRQEIQRTAS